MNVIAFGAHPDDCPHVAAGVSALWSSFGHPVKFGSMTDGVVGRSAEARRGAEILGVESQVLDVHDGELLPTLENRKAVVRLIREWKADLVLSHRPNDDHPDRRTTGFLVQEAATLVTVPDFCPDTPNLAKNPIFLYYEDQFRKPDIVVAIDDVIEKKIAALETMESPCDEGTREERQRQVRERCVHHFSSRAELFRSPLADWYGSRRGMFVSFAEAFEISE